MVKLFSLGTEPVVGNLNSSRKKEYRVTNRLQEGKRPLYAVVFNFIDSRYFNVFATVGGNRVLFLFLFNSKISFFLCTRKFQSFTLFLFPLLGYYLSVPSRRSYCCIAVFCRWWCKATPYSPLCLTFCIFVYLVSTTTLIVVFLLLFIIIKKKQSGSILIYFLCRPEGWIFLYSKLGMQYQWGSTCCGWRSQWYNSSH